MTADLRALLARHPAPWKVVGDEEFGYEWVEGANGVKVFDDGSAGGEYDRACKPETMALIVAAVNALPGLLDERDRLERVSAARLWLYESARAHVVEVMAERDRLQADLAEAVGLLRRVDGATRDLERDIHLFLIQHEGGRDA